MIPSYDRNDAESALKLIQDSTLNAKRIQDKVLEEILTHNADTEYLRRFLDGQSDKQSFEKKVPMVTYEDLEPYMDRLANGEPSNIICSQPITRFLKSSGTSGGAQKRLPTTEQDMESRAVQQNLLMHVEKKYISGLRGGKGMMILFNTQEFETPSGLLSTSVSSVFLKSRKSKGLPMNGFSSSTCPDDIILCLDVKQSLYCQLLCGLVRRDETLWVGAVFASTFVRAIKFLETHWRELCSNIRTGHVSGWITDLDCRTSMDSVLTGPIPELADSIERECNQKSWEGIIGKIWPRAKYIRTIVTGTMAEYVPILDFHSGELPIVSSSYGCSEGRFGINLEPLSKPCDVSYLLLPFVAYFEFLPVDENASNDEDEDCVRDDDRLVSLVDVKLDCCYELMVTTYAGLYRYRMGDILKVTSFYNNSPKFQFIQRQGVLLSIDVEKTSEEDLFKAMKRAKRRLEPLGLMLMDYTSYSDLSSFPGHYVLFWELIAKDGKDVSKLDPGIIEDCCFILEDSFDHLYKKFRSNGYNSIGPLEIRLVKQGTFDELTDFFNSRCASSNQYKTPRGIKSKEALKLLDSRVVANFFSQKSLSLDS